MKTKLRIASLVLASLLFFSYNSLKAQVKIGGNPAVVDPNALLELESNRKGLLLPRLDDGGFGIIQNANATVGMVIYYTGSAYQGTGLYVKQTAGNGADKWVRMASAEALNGAWKITGNNGIDPVTQYIGTNDAQPLVFKTDGAERFRMNADGTFTMDLAGIADEPTENQVLLIASDGTIKRKLLDMDVVKSLNGLKGDINIEVEADGLHNEAGLDVDGSVDPRILKLQLPVMEGTSSQVYGFMKLEDWEKLNNLVTNGLTMGALLTDNSYGAFGASIVSTGDGQYTIHLGAASATANGVVTTGTQTFAGDKTFTGITNLQKDVFIGDASNISNLTVKGKLDIGYADLYAPSATPATYELLVQEGPAATEVKRFSLPAWKLDGGIAAVNGVSGALADGNMTFAVDTGATVGANVLIEDDVASNTITLKIPDAAPGNTRGLVTDQEQTIGGKKVFNSNVTVGGSASGTSSLNVNGSIGVQFRKTAVGVDIDVNDYIILVKPTGTADVTLMLPDPFSCSGRVYVIKREAKGYPIDEVAEAFSVVIGSYGGTGKFHGENTTPLTVPNTTLHVMSDGSNWHILSRGTGF